MGIIFFVSWVLVIATVAAFFLVLSEKWGIREWLQMHSPNEMMNQMFTCDFCCLWWLSCIISVILILFTGEWMLLLAALCSTLIARKLL